MLISSCYLFNDIIFCLVTSFLAVIRQQNQDKCAKCLTINLINFVHAVQITNDKQETCFLSDLGKTLVAYPTFYPSSLLGDFQIF